MREGKNTIRLANASLRQNDACRIHENEVSVHNTSICLPVRLERYIVERNIQSCMGHHVPITPTQHDHRKQQQQQSKRFEQAASQWRVASHLQPCPPHSSIPT